MTAPIESTVTINAPLSTVWDALTKPDLIKQWMAEPQVRLEIITDWEVGGPIIFKGYQHGKFVNTGTILQLEPNKILQYTHLSSVSRLPDMPENYTVFEFRLSPAGDQTELRITISNFPTESIFKHLEFYWKATAVIIKRFVEEELVRKTG